MRIPEYTAKDAARAMQSISDRLAAGKVPWIQDIGLMWQFVKQAEQAEQAEGAGHTCPCGTPIPLRDITGAEVSRCRRCENR